jgi:glycosyltransferase involved in cell wall biosynthesis
VRITQVCTSDISGGAARSAYRLHTGLRRTGEESTLFVQTRESNDPSVVGFSSSVDSIGRVRRGIRKWVIQGNASKLAAKRPWNASYFSDDRSEHFAEALKQFPACDVVHLHWFSGFLDYRSFFSQVPKNLPIVWTLHDMNSFTGGCHFDNGCGRFTNCCGACPQLGSQDNEDFSRAVWTRKREAYASVNRSKLHLVTPSHWLAREAQRSSLLAERPISVIPYGLDTEVFQPRDRKASRNVLGIPADAKVILFLADWVSEARKGFSLLRQALNEIPDKSNLTLLTMGRGPADTQLDIPTIRLAYLGEERFLSMVYSAADIFVLPALQDNFPNTALESLACGVPVVAFNVGGVPEIIRHGIEGSLVPPGDVQGLRSAICAMLDEPEVLQRMKVNARQRILLEYKLEFQAQRYIELYRKALASQC